MHGTRICNGEFDWYKQLVKPLGGGCLLGKHPPSATDLNYFSNDIVNLIYKKLQIQLPSWIEAWEQMVPNLGTSYIRLGSSPFTTMASMLNFFCEFSL